jgi:hypothetical protein
MSVLEFNVIIRVLLERFVSFGELSPIGAITEDLAKPKSLSDHFNEIGQSVANGFNEIKNRHNEKKNHQLHKKGLQTDT